MKDVHKMAPEYLTETFTVESDYLPEDGYTEKGLIQVKIQVAPHHKETPGIRIYYPYKDSVSVIFSFKSFPLFLNLYFFFSVGRSQDGKSN